MTKFQEYFSGLKDCENYKDVTEVYVRATEIFQILYEMPPLLKTLYFNRKYPKIFYRFKKEITFIRLAEDVVEDDGKTKIEAKVLYRCLVYHFCRAEKEKYFWETVKRVLDEMMNDLDHFICGERK